MYFMRKSMYKNQRKIQIVEIVETLYCERPINNSLQHPNN